ncbi:MAG: type II toxin-antitoxin system prevent-host-death family antitoxin [Roseinatronobacter sp.]|nr:type II toxin-antitoxin system prevent-host-death family antitoxin [Roseinatronobacter sp.]
MVYTLPHMTEDAMQLPITDAKARLTDLVREAEAGEDVVLTRHGHTVARLVAMHPKPSAKNRAKVIDAVRAQAAAGASAARSQEFLYDDDGLPK